MGAPQTYKTQAIVLKRRELGEADSLVTLYTPYLGKIRAVARGARRPKSKLGGHLEPLTCCDAQLAGSRSLDVITQCQTVESFMALRDDLWRSSCGVYAAELVDRFTPDSHENPAVFELLLGVLRWLCRVRQNDGLLRCFELHLLDSLGYRPQLQQCVACDAVLLPEENTFSSSGGGMLCPGCRGRESYGMPVSVNALKALRFLQRNEFAEACRLQVAPPLSGELERLLQGYIRYVLEREVKSAEWIARLKSGR